MIPARGPQTTVHFVIKHKVYAHKVCKCTAVISTVSPYALNLPFLISRQQPFERINGSFGRLFCDGSPDAAARLNSRKSGSFKM